jgi:hypothetical protein
VLHGEIEKRMGRPVWTHELGSHELMENEIKPKFKADFLAMIPANAPREGRAVARTLDADVRPEVTHAER